MDELIVNGQKKSYDAGRLPGTIAALLNELNLEAATVVAEVDGEIVARERFDHTPLRSGQAIELVRFVPGG